MLYICRHYYWIKFFVGKRPMMRRGKGFHLSNDGISRLGRKIRAFIESGCYHYKINMPTSSELSGNMRNYTKSIVESMQRPDLFEPLNLSKAISAVFIIFSGMLLVTMVVHALTVLYFYRSLVAGYCIRLCRYKNSCIKQKNIVGKKCRGSCQEDV